MQWQTALPGLALRSVKRLRDATHAVCDTCGVIGANTDPVPWSISNTKWMHERGIGQLEPGHRVRYAILFAPVTS